MTPRAEIVVSRVRVGLAETPANKRVEPVMGDLSGEAFCALVSYCVS